MRVFMSLAALAALGCQASPRTLATNVGPIAERCVRMNLAETLEKHPEKADTLLPMAKRTSDIIQREILPLVAEAATADLLREAFLGAVERLEKITDPLVMRAVYGGILLLPLPENPAQELDPELRRAAHELFAGIARGLASTKDVTVKVQ